MTQFLTQRWLPGPAWLHFLFGGALLYALAQALFPPPTPVLGPPSSVRLSQRVEEFGQLMGRYPEAEEREVLVEQLLREQLLFREAIARELYLADAAVEQRIIRNMRFLDPDDQSDSATLVARGFDLGMHLTDEVIRRRLIQVMERLLIANSVREPVGDAALREYYERHLEQYQTQPTLTFRHVFLGAVSEAQARDELHEIQNAGLGIDDVQSRGQPFLSGLAFEALDAQAITQRFGREFAEALAPALAGQQSESGWFAAVESVFGLHWVWIDAWQPARTRAFDEVAEQIRWDLMQRAEQEALDRAVAMLMTHYEVRRS